MMASQAPEEAGFKPSESLISQKHLTPKVVTPSRDSVFIGGNPAGLGASEESGGGSGLSPFLHKAGFPAQEELASGGTTTHVKPTTKGYTSTKLHELLGPIGKDTTRGAARFQLIADPSLAEDTKLLSTDSGVSPVLLKCSRFVLGSTEGVGLPEVDFTMCSPESGTPVAQLRRAVVPQGSLPSPAAGTTDVELQYVLKYLPSVIVPAEKTSGAHATDGLVGAHDPARPKYRHGRRGKIVALAVLGVARMLAMSRSANAASKDAPKRDGESGHASAARTSIHMGPVVERAMPPPGKRVLAELTMKYRPRSRTAQVTIKVEDAINAIADNASSVKPKRAEAVVITGTATFSSTDLVGAVLRSERGDVISITALPGTSSYTCECSGEVSPALSLAAVNALLDILTLNASYRV